MGAAWFAVWGTLVVVFQTLTLVSAEEPSCVPGFTSDMYIFKVARTPLHRGMRLGKVDFTDCTDRKTYLLNSDDTRFSVQLDGTLKVNRPVVLHGGHRDLNIHAWDSWGRKFTVPVRVVHHHGGQHHGDHHGGQHHGDHHGGQHHGDHHGGQHHGDHHGGQHHGHHHGGQHHGHHHGGQHQGDHHRENHQDHQNHHGEDNHHVHPSNTQVEESATNPPAPVLHVQKTEEGSKRNKRELGMKSDSDVPLPVLFFPKATEGLKRRKREWIIPVIKVSENNKGPFPERVVQIRSSEDKEKAIHYSITGPGADLPPIGLFTMDRNTGVMYVTQPLDREKQANYSLLAHAVADTGGGENPMEINVIVIDQNDNKPAFTEETYLGEVAESSPIGFEIMQVTAIDLDEPGNYNSEVQYRIESQDPKVPKALMFEINPVNGFIRVKEQGLDREKFPKYTLDIWAADNKGDGLQGRTKVILTVTDSNDNAPVYTQNNYEASIPENKVDAFVTKMTVNDRDDPHTPAWNAKFKIVGGDPGGLFSVKTGPNKQEGIITTAKGLDFEMSRKHTLLVAVENEVPFALPLATATATVVVNVEDVNEAPIFEPLVKQVAKSEDLAEGKEVVQYIAHDPDTALNQKVMYKIISDPAGWLNVTKDTGVIKVKSLMDRESHFVKDNVYTALIGGYDDDEVPATGTGTLQILLEDVNDNAPTIEERNIRVCNKDSVPQLLTVTDKDGQGNAAPFRVSLKGPSKTNWTARMNDTKTGIILNLATQLESGIYTVIMRVGDNHGMEQDSTIQAEVCDCSGDKVQCSKAIAGGPPLPVILGILGGILLLLMLVLLLLLFARRRGVEKKEPLLQDDDIRDNIYYYDEEGGGEDDQDYDLSVLHRGLDNRPEVFRNDVVPNFLPAPQYRPRPANPEEIGNFIDDNLKAADNDPTAPPYDSLLVFDYEGGGSDAGSLSSLNSSSSGDQDYNCLNEWGPRFKKLADMYGGGEDDDML